MSSFVLVPEAPVERDVVVLQHVAEAALGTVFAGDADVRYLETRAYEADQVLVFNRPVTRASHQPMTSSDHCVSTW